MISSKNRLKLDLSSNPDLEAALGGLTSGDRGSIEFAFMVVENGDGNFEADIEEITYDTPESDDSETIEPSADEPVMAVISKRNKSTKSDKKDAETKADAKSTDEEVE